MPANDEQIDRVDENDLVVGSTTVEDAVNHGLLHRAVAVLVMRSDGRFLLQQRSTRDVWHPGSWTISSTGHVMKGEAYQAAAVRELREELGLTPGVSTYRKYLLPPFRSGGLVEHEWVTLFTAQTDAPCRIDTVEVERVNEVDGIQLRRLIDRGSLTPDAVILLRDYLEGRDKH